MTKVKDAALIGIKIEKLSVIYDLLVFIGVSSVTLRHHCTENDR